MKTPTLIPIVLLALLFLISPEKSHADLEHLCDQIYITDGKLKINENEKTMICGADAGVQGWVQVPLPQAQLHLKSILQNLGYLKPTFERDGEQLKVTKGPQSEIKSFKVEGADGILHPEKKRKVIGEKLMPLTLNDVQQWANLGIRSQGYACDEIRVEALASDESVTVRTNLGVKNKIGTLKTEELEGLDPRSLSRYQPFSLGDDYDIRKAQLMTSRMLADGLFQSAFFETTCSDNLAHLDLKTSMGRPRIVRFSLGASTEEFPFVDLMFKNTRLDDKASSVTSTLHASPRLQSLITESELYWINGWYRAFLGPRFRLAREIESSYETDSARAGIDIGRKWDAGHTRFLGRIGPTYNYVETKSGVGPGNVKYPSLDASLVVMDHVYEATVWQQYEGWNASLFLRSQGKGLGSNIDVNRYEGNFKYLWNYNDYHPPLFVLGTRFQAIAVDAPDLDNPAQAALIPVEERVFVGGQENLRGFPRKGINNGGVGYLSFFYTGFELRLVEELPFRLEPFLLFDIGRVGNRRYTVDAPTFTSEGAGIRWLSPFGTLRGSAARGRIWNKDASVAGYPEQWVYFFSFGTEF